MASTDVPPLPESPKRTRLCFKRRVGERVMIGREIIVAISSIEGRGRRVELLIEAPEHISVDREEVYLKKRSVKSAPAPTEPRGAPR